MTDTNVSSLVLKKGSNRYIFDPSGNLDLSNYYTKSEADGKYALKTDLNKYSLTTHTHSQYATTTAVTNAQNTANNALNVANSKATLEINKQMPYGSSFDNYWSGTRFTYQHNLYFPLINAEGEGNFAITLNGFNLFGGYVSASTTIPVLLYGKNQVFSCTKLMDLRAFYL